MDRCGTFAQRPRRGPEGGELIAASGLEPRYCFTSYLRRAIRTLDIALDAMDEAVAAGGERLAP